MKKIFLYAYDRRNLGDDLFVHVITKRYPDVKFYMWSDKMNRETFASLPNLKVIDKDSRFVRFLSRLRPSLAARYKAWLEKRCDAVVYIGGSIFFEYDHGEGISVWWDHMAEHHPFYVMGANFGPYKTEAYREKMASIFGKMRDICFRDRYSYKLFSNIPTVRYAPDILFSCPMPQAEVKKKQLYVSVINCMEKAEGDHSLAQFEKNYILNMVSLLKSYLSDGWHILLASFCEDEGDCRAIEKIYRSLPVSEGQIEILSYDGTNSRSMLESMAASEYVITSRFHGVVLALAAGKPVFPIVYSNKTTQFLEDISFKGNWADLRNERQITFEDSLKNYIIPYNTVDFCISDESHFFALDKLYKCNRG